MSTEVWAPTHRVPAGGATCWANPDGTVAPLAERLDAELEVRVVEERGGWGHVECSNGWTAWIDARGLERLAPPEPPPPPTPPVAPAFQATHRVPAGGLAAYAEHDLVQPAVASLDEALPVQVVERWGDWAQIACSNGWSAWVDGRTLQPAGAGAAYQPAPTASNAQRRNPLAAALLLLCTMPRSVAGPAAVGALAALGTALVAVGSFLPLVSVSGLPSVSAWDTPAAFLVSDTPGPSDVKLGMVLLVAVLALFPLLSRRALPPLLLFAFAAPATNLGIHVMLIKARTPGYPDLGAGTLMVFAGGILIVAQAGWWAWRERRRAFA